VALLSVAAKGEADTYKHQRDDGATWAALYSIGSYESSMSIITLLLVLIIVGVGLYLVNTVIPMDAKIKTILNVVVILLVLLWLLDVFIGFGHIGTVGTMRVGKC
jgi:hypothetical protein